MSDAFPLPLKGRLVWTGPRKAELIAPFYFLSSTRGVTEVPTGFDTDYASVPRIFWSIYPPDGIYTPAALVHDFKYKKQDCTRAEADALFLEAMAACGVPWLRRHILHKSVRAGGWLAWRRNQKKQSAAVLSP